MSVVFPLSSVQPLETMVTGRLVSFEMILSRSLILVSFFSSPVCIFVRKNDRFFVITFLVVSELSFCCEKLLAGPMPGFL